MSPSTHVTVQFQTPQTGRSVSFTSSGQQDFRTDFFDRTRQGYQHPYNEAMRTALRLPASVSFDPALTREQARLVFREMVKTSEFPWTAYSFSQFRDSAWRNQAMDITIGLSETLPTLGVVSPEPSGMRIEFSTLVQVATDCC